MNTTIDKIIAHLPEIAERYAKIGSSLDKKYLRMFHDLWVQTVFPCVYGKDVNCYVTPEGQGYDVFMDGMRVNIKSLQNKGKWMLKNTHGNTRNCIKNMCDLYFFIGKVNHNAIKISLISPEIVGQFSHLANANAQICAPQMADSVCIYSQVFDVQRVLPLKNQIDDEVKNMFKKHFAY